MQRSVIATRLVGVVFLLLSFGRSRWSHRLHSFRNDNRRLVRIVCLLLHVRRSYGGDCCRLLRRIVRCRRFSRRRCRRCRYCGIGRSQCVEQRRLHRCVQLACLSHWSSVGSRSALRHRRGGGHCDIHSRACSAGRRCLRRLDGDHLGLGSRDARRRRCCLRVHWSSSRSCLGFHRLRLHWCRGRDGCSAFRADRSGCCNVSRCRRHLPLLRNRLRRSRRRRRSGTLDRRSCRSRRHDRGRSCNGGRGGSRRRGGDRSRSHNWSRSSNRSLHGRRSCNRSRCRRRCRLRNRCRRGN